jgi:hypothetical protein
MVEEKGLNYDLYKSAYKSHRKALRKMLKAIVVACPRDILIKVLKEKKIIVQDWSRDGNKYIERRPKGLNS